MGESTSSIQLAKGGQGEDKARLLFEEASERTRNNGHRLQLEKYSLKLRKKKILSERIFRYQNRFHREIVKSLSLEIFRIELDRVLNNTT